MSIYWKIFPWYLHFKNTEGSCHEINVNDLYKMNSQFGFALKIFILFKLHEKNEVLPSFIVNPTTKIKNLPSFCFHVPT